MAARRLPPSISAIARLPILIPGVIVGISLLILVNLVGFGPSRIAIVLGHILVALPTTVVVMRSRFAAIPKTIREAALDLGASRLDDIQAGACCRSACRRSPRPSCWPS